MTNTSNTYHITHEIKAKSIQEALASNGKVLSVVLCDEGGLEATEIGFKG